MIIPAIDLLDNTVVRLTEGKYDAVSKYAKDPVDVAKQFEDAGLKRLHVVDLEGARSGKPHHLSILEKIASATRLSIDFSGGLRTTQDLTDAHNAGAAFVSIGSVAVKQPQMLEEWLSLFPNDFFILSADSKHGEVKVSGWEEGSAVQLTDFLEKWAKRIPHIICTDITKDGMLQGPSVELYREILAQFPDIQLIASGGVSQMSDIEACMQVGCSGVIVGKALYEGKIQLA